MDMCQEMSQWAPTTAESRARAAHHAYQGIDSARSATLLDAETERRAELARDDIENGRAYFHCFTASRGVGSALFGKRGKAELWRIVLNDGSVWRLGGEGSGGWLLWVSF